MFWGNKDKKGLFDEIQDRSNDALKERDEILIKEKKKRYIFTYHFVCGKSLIVDYNEEEKDKALSYLTDNNWDKVTSTARTHGFNFSMVTHFTIEEQND